MVGMHVLNETILDYDVYGYIIWEIRQQSGPHFIS